MQSGVECGMTEMPCASCAGTGHVPKDHEIRRLFGRHLHAQRLEQHSSLGDTVRAWGVSPADVSAWERGLSPPLPPEVAQALDRRFAEFKWQLLQDAYGGLGANLSLGHSLGQLLTVDMSCAFGRLERNDLYLADVRKRVEARAAARNTPRKVPHS